jgi:nucleoside-diphosphate-sugar epimerase
MQKIDKNKPVLVTGGSGYMASWIIKMLLAEGISVNTTVRDPSNTDKTRHLSSLEKESGAKLRLFKADLLDPAGFDEAMGACELVIHTASPFFLTGIKEPEKELIQPAKQGTTNVLEAAKRIPAVKRVVLTSSAAAVFGDNVDIKLAPEGKLTENHWNVTSSVKNNPYAYSKTVAEKQAWAIAGSQDRWDLLVINPGWILGPSLSKRKDALSVRTMIQLGDGTFRSGVPEFWNGIVDVRDVASAHIKAGFTPSASGRHILVSEEATLFDIVGILRKRFGEAYPFPKRQVPKPLFWLVAPSWGYTRKYVSRNIGTRIRFDNSYSRADLKMSYIPIERTVAEHFQQIIDDGLLGK